MPEAIFTSRGDQTEILMYDPIGEWFDGISARQFVIDLSGVESSEINLRINSEGGTVFDGIPIYNALVRHPATVNVHIDGTAASIAAVIAQAGDSINMAENAEMMIHNAWGGVFAGIIAGDADELEEAADEISALLKSEATALREVNLRIAGVLANRSGQDVDSVLSMMKATTEMGAEQAIELGFADGIGQDNKRVVAAKTRDDITAIRAACKSVAVSVEDIHTVCDMLPPAKPVATPSVSSFNKRAAMARTQLQKGRLNLLTAK